MPERVILLIEDSDDDAFLTKKKLEDHLEGEFTLLRLMTVKAAKDYIKEHKEYINLILLDLRLPDTNDEEDTFSAVKEYSQDIPIVILTSTQDHHLAVKLVGEGAENFINKDLLHERPELLRDAVDFAISRHRLAADFNRQNLETLAQKDMIISWMSGGYSLQK